jgi:hypothetical protein
MEMNASRKSHLLYRVLWIAFVGCAPIGYAHAENSIVRWERIEGIDPIEFGQEFGGILPVTVPWSTTDGRAMVNLETGRVQFHVEALSVGAGPTPLVRIGSTGIVEAVRGTLMCHQTGEFVDTDATELSGDGDAMYSGQLESLPNCDPTDLIFLLRIAAVTPGAPPVTDLWLAHGAARKIR